MNLKERFVIWLFKDIVIDEMRTQGLYVRGGNTLYVDIWDWDHNTTDPSNSESIVWYNSSDSTMRYRTDAATVDF